MSFITFIIIAAVIFGLAMLAKHNGIYWLQLTLGACFFGFIGGGITYWIFDSFWWGFFIAAVITGISFLGDHEESSSSSYSSSDYSSSSSYSSPRPYVSAPDDGYEERLRQRRSEENRASYERQADEAYSHYQSYLSQAESEESQAETELRYAEDYDYRAREYGDDSARSQASSCRSNARYNQSRAREYRSKADYYYGLYQEYKDRARSC